MSDAETFSAEDPYAPRRNSGCWIVALILGLTGGAAVLLAGCCGGFVYAGMGIVAEQVRTDLRGNGVIDEHLGPITSIEVEWMSSLAAPGEDEYVFNVEGPKGTGRVQVVSETVDAGAEKVTSGFLELPNGDRHDLFPGEAADSL